MTDSVDYNAATDGFRITFSTGYRVGYFIVNLLLTMAALFALLSVFGAVRTGGLFGVYWLRLPIALGVSAFVLRRVFIGGLTAPPVTVNHSGEVRRGFQRVQFRDRTRAILTGPASEVKLQFYQSDLNFPYGVEQFRFADGTIWDRQAIALMALRGTAGDDVLVGYDGNDLLDGGAGNDLLIGGTGSDTYLFGRKSGNDTIEEAYDPSSKDTDIVLFDADIKPDDITVRRDGSGSDLLVTVSGSDNVLRIKMQLYQSGSNLSYGIEQFRFADGTTWDKTTINAKALTTPPKLTSAKQTFTPATSDASTYIESKLDLLIQTMASIAPPALSDSAWQQSSTQALTPSIAANCF
jgi:hypothetical protein